MTGSVRQPFPVLAINMNQPGSFVHWSIFPFPGGHPVEPAAGGGPAGGDAGAAAAADDDTARM